MGDLRGSDSIRVMVSTGMGRAMVLEPKTIQRVRGEKSVSSDHIQRHLRLLLQSSPASPLRDHSSSL